MKDGEGINQRTFIHDSWTQTIIWGLNETGEGVGLHGGGKGGESRNNCNSINNKKNRSAWCGEH